MNIELNQIWECPYGQKYKVIGEVVGDEREGGEWIFLDMDSKIKDITFKLNKAGGNFSRYCHKLIKE